MLSSQRLSLSDGFLNAFGLLPLFGLSPLRFHVRQRDEPILSPVVGAATGILASITRDRIMKVVPVEESDSYQLKHVLEAAEVFLASSLREVQGVRCLDGLEFTCPGPVTRRVAGLLSERIEAELSGALQLEGA